MSERTTCDCCSEAFLPEDLVRDPDTQLFYCDDCITEFISDATCNRIREYYYGEGGSGE